MAVIIGRMGKAFEVVVGLLMVTFAMLLVVGSLRGCEAWTCDDMGRTAEVETKFDWLTGCYVKINGHWVPSSRWRAVEGD